MKKKLFFLCVIFPLTVCAKKSEIITADNQTDKSVYAAVYCDPIIFGSTTTREYDPVEISAHSQEPVQRPSRSTMCNRYLVFADSSAQLTHQLTKKQFQRLTGVGVGTTTFGRMFNYFYVLEKDGKLKAYNPFNYLGSGKTSLEEFAQTQAARLVLKDSALVQDNPYKNTQATVRISTQLNPDEQLYVNKRHETVKNALEKFIGKKLNNKKVTIAAINSGGGTRAMICMTGFHIGMHNKGLLDALMYDVTLSGSTWLVPLWIHSGQTIDKYKDVVAKSVEAGMVGTLTDNEQYLFESSILVRLALGQTISPLNFWGALLATRYLALYKDKRQAVLSSQTLTMQHATKYPFPIATAVSTFDLDDTYENRARVNWYEFTPYEIGGVGSWLGNAFVPTWAFGRKFNNKTSLNFNPEYDLGLLMGIWASALAVSYSRIYEEMLSGLGALRVPFDFVQKKMGSNWQIFQKNKLDIFMSKVNNFTYGIEGAPYKDKDTLFMGDAGIGFVIPYPPVSGHGSRTADILIFFNASADLEAGSAESLRLSEMYARAHNLKFPELPKGQAFAKATNKALAIFKDESDPEVPLVIYISSLVDRNAITYDASIPKDYKSQVGLTSMKFNKTQFNRLSLVTQQNLEQSIDQIKEAITWKIGQIGGFVD